MRAITRPASFLCTTNQTAVPLTWVPQRARCAICGHTNAHARVGQKAPASTGSIKWFGAESQSSPARPGCLQPRAGREGRDEGTEHPNNRSSKQQMKVGTGLHFGQCPDNKCVCMCVCVRECARALNTLHAPGARTLLWPQPSQTQSSQRLDTHSVTCHNPGHMTRERGRGGDGCDEPQKAPRRHLCAEHAAAQLHTPVVAWVTRRHYAHKRATLVHHHHV